MRKPPPRGKTKFNHLTSCNTIQKRLRARYKVLGTWRAVGAEIGVSSAIVYRVATSNYEPKNNAIRRALGLPLYATVEVCAHCGEAHKAYKVCPKDSKPRAPRRRWPQLIWGKPDYRKLSEEEIERIKK